MTTTHAQKTVAIKRNNSTQFHIVVRSFLMYDMQGEVMHASTQKRQRFEGILALLSFLERCIDQFGSLQQTHKPREWMGLELKDMTQELKEDELMPKGEAAESAGAPSFVVRVQYRYNATWQGTLQWLEGNQTMRFRSTLEMIRLMEDVIERCDIPMDDEEK